VGDRREPTMRIGALAARLGVSVDTLRAWERRYAVIAPARTAAGFRLYSLADEDTIRAMLGHMEGGLAPAQAAGLARGAAPAPLANEGRLDLLRAELLAAFLSFDAVEAHRIVDEAVATFALPTVINDVWLWCLREIGDRWASGTATVAEEHFASAVIRERMLGMGRDWDAGHGPRALLACPVGERHDVGLIGLGLALGRLGWRITFLGPDTPTESIRAAAANLQPSVVVISALTPAPLLRDAAALQELAGAFPVVLAGPGAAHVVAEELGARVVAGDPVAAARDVAAHLPGSEVVARPA